MHDGIMMHYKLFEAGYCSHCQRITRRGGRLQKAQYPALCALINHPKEGYILFDTGYSERFHQLTRKFPYSLYRYLTPVQLNYSLKDQLLAHAIQPHEIKTIVISHFHADHIGGLRDFPQARFVCHQDALADIQGKRGVKALLQGFLPDLLPEDFTDRWISIDATMLLPSILSPFTHGFDLFGDGMLWIVPLPGHAPGQIGLFFHAPDPVFLVADSCWHSETIQQLHLPSHLTRLVHHDWHAYITTIHQLHVLAQQQPSVKIIPSHCQKFRPNTC